MTRVNLGYWCCVVERPLALWLGGGWRKEVSLLGRHLLGVWSPCSRVSNVGITTGRGTEPLQYAILSPVHCPLPDSLLGCIPPSLLLSTDCTSPTTGCLERGHHSRETGGFLRWCLRCCETNMGVLLLFDEAVCLAALFLPHPIPSRTGNAARLIVRRRFSITIRSTSISGLSCMATRFASSMCADEFS